MGLRPPLIAILVTLSSCARGSEPTVAPAASPPRGQPPATAPRANTVVPARAPAVNLLVNPGFEEGSAGWTHMGTANWGAFSVVTSPFRSGGRAARLDVVAKPGEALPASRVFGVVQELRREEMPGGFPETLSGHYRVERWGKEAPGTFLYIQAVVIVWGDPRTPALLGQGNVTNYQIRFMVAGSQAAPFNISNAHYDFLSREQPPIGQWVAFEIPIRKKFQELWGVVPDGYEFLRILYEARWDHRDQPTGVDAVVLFDDLFVGYGSPGGAP